MERTTYVERVMIVLNPDGTLKGAHQDKLERITSNGETLVERMLGAEPLDAAALASVLPDHAALAAQVQALTDERDDLAAKLAAANDEIEALKA